MVQCLFTLLGISHSVRRLVSAPTLADQRRLWDSSALIYFLKQGPQLLVWAFKKLCALLLFNRVVLWFGGGVPCKQLKLILEDKVPIEHYIARTMDGVAENSHLRTQNYFYYNCLTGHFTRDNCPSYLKEVRGWGVRSRQMGATDRHTGGCYGLVLAVVGRVAHQVCRCHLANSQTAV